eukprot:301103-Rhodomonas_salina.1
MSVPSIAEPTHDTTWVQPFAVDLEQKISDGDLVGSLRGRAVHQIVDNAQCILAVHCSSMTCT